MTASRPSVDAKLVLDRDDLDVVNVQEIRRTPVGVDLLFVDLKTDTRRIIVAFRVIVNCSHEALAMRVRGCDRLANVGRKCRDATLPWHIISKKGDAVDRGHELA